MSVIGEDVNTQTGWVTEPGWRFTGTSNYPVNAMSKKDKGDRIMKKKRTLEELERAAEQQWEKEAKRLIQTIAERENVEFAELYPHLIDYGLGSNWVHASFKFPGHSLVVLQGGLGEYPPLELTEKGLQGKYIWMAHINPRTGGQRYTGYDSLGEALLTARWSYKQDARALWK